MQYRLSPGYRGYYDAMYDAFFYLPTIGEALQSNYKRKEDLESYEFRTISLTHPKSDLDALKGLREIYQILGLSTINRLKNTKDARDCAIKICDVILKYVESAKWEPIVPPSMPSSGEGDGEENEEQSEQQESNDNTPDDIVAADPDAMTVKSNEPQESKEGEKEDGKGKEGKDDDDNERDEETGGEDSKEDESTDKSDSGDKEDGNETPESEKEVRRKRKESKGNKEKILMLELMINLSEATQKMASSLNTLKENLTK